MKDELIQLLCGFVIGFFFRIYRRDRHQDDKRQDVLWQITALRIEMLARLNDLYEERRSAKK